MPRRLTAEEADKVSSFSRGNGERPALFSASSGMEEEISDDFEVYLILTDIGTRTRISNFLQVILDNNPNDLESYNELLTEFISEEINNAVGRKREFAELTEAYDDVRQAYSLTLDGFSDINETSLLQEVLTNSLGSSAEQRDRFSFNFAALQVLQSRAESGGAASFRQELQSWVRLLVEYE